MRPFVVIALLFCTSYAFAGWQKIAQLEQKATCCFFFDDMTGLAGSGEYNGWEILKIWRTNDGGLSWLPCNVPLGSGQVTSIRMQSALVGYASIFSMTHPEYSLWKTTDGGYSWFDYSNGNGGYTADVWMTNRAITKTKWSVAAGGSTPGGSSTDGGLTFRQWFSKGTDENSNGIFFTTDMIGVATAGPNINVAWYTTDGGVSWLQGGAQGEAWSAWGFDGSNVFFAVEELQRELIWSTNGGRTWSRRYDFDPILANNAITTGHISGKGSVMYVQTYGGGMLRTGANDSGKTWRPIGGPSNVVDSRAFYVGGCAGEIVIAFDLDGSVWKTTDGGDGTLGNTNPLILNHINFPLITACSQYSHFGTIAFGDCGEFVITSAMLENDANGVFTLMPIPLPDTLTAGGVDTFFVTFDPHGNPGTYSARIRIKGKINRLGNIIPIDSVIRISASASAVLPKLISSLHVVSFAELSVCEPRHDTLITLKNEGCDTLTITSGPTAAPPFTVQQLPLPLILPPDSTTSFTISFSPTTGGSFNNSTRIQASSQGKQQEIEILLDGKARYGAGTLSIPKTSFLFKTLSICSTDSVEGFITNTGCDTLLLDSTTFSSDADFTVSAASFANGMKLRPGDTIWFVIDLKPLQKGIRSGTFTVFFHNEHGSFPQQSGQFTFSANVLDGTRSVSQSLNAIDFGSSDLCTEFDTIFTLRNTGCDTVEVTATLQGLGFEMPGVTWPIFLLPGEARDIRIRTNLDTAGNRSQSTAFIAFDTKTANPLTPIQLKRSYIFPKQYSVRLTLDRTQGISGGLVHLAIIGEMGLGSAGNGVRSLEATVTLNEDLLHFISAAGPNTVVRNGSAIRVTNTPELLTTPSGALAELTYQIYLTKDSATDIVLSDVILNDGDTSACASTILSGANPDFSYSFECGDHTIQKFLSTESPLNIVSIRPNPARDEITVELATESAEAVEVEIFNDAGDRILSSWQAAKTIKLSVAALAEGSYTMRVRQSQSTAITRFVVVK